MRTPCACKERRALSERVSRTDHEPTHLKTITGAAASSQCFTIAIYEKDFASARELINATIGYDSARESCGGCSEHRRVRSIAWSVWSAIRHRHPIAHPQRVQAVSVTRVSRRSVFDKFHWKRFLNRYMISGYFKISHHKTYFEINTYPFFVVTRDARDRHHLQRQTVALEWNEYSHRWRPCDTPVGVEGARGREAIDGECTPVMAKRAMRNFSIAPCTIHERADRWGEGSRHKQGRLEKLGQAWALQAHHAPSRNGGVW